jgi:lipid-A-disaccharide synthase
MVMGFMEVVKHLPQIFRNFRRCEDDIKRFNPDVVIMVDYPGFNLRMAQRIKKHGFKVFYYIAPKIWAWNQSRVHKIKKYIDKVFTILPFETEFYKRFGVAVAYSGNPLLDAIHSRPHKKESPDDFRRRHQLPDKPIIALLAGSRKEEINRLLPDMISMMPFFPEFQFVVAGAPSFTPADYDPYVADVKEVKVVFHETYSILQQAHAAMVTSGTATLETALLKCPQVVCYKMWGGSFTDFVSKKIIIKVPYISLVNLIMNRPVVKELFQNTFSREELHHELEKLCYNQVYRADMLKGYEELSYLMGGAGSSARTALLMWESLKE